DIISVMTRDITAEKKAEEDLKKALAEKEILLKEIHHRVKNNLMIISSLLNLQSQYIEDEETLEVFKKSQTRAQSMALIHEKLYGSDDLKSINFSEYIQKLASDIFKTYLSDNGNIKLNLQVEDHDLDINTTIPLGLIVNELISNCIKYAFPYGKKGEINVEFLLTDGTFVLEVSDNGVGFPNGLDFRETKSLGLQLVNSLTNQIDGSIEMCSNGGTKFKISFQEEKYD
ncbi:MAG: sensor histidine kinase, partial [Euryarchaeota archaeon]|nr:sensor histidine kinase [Euryarchaeota archaeon]